MTMQYTQCNCGYAGATAAIAGSFAIVLGLELTAAEYLVSGSWAG